ncbi:MAG: VCBS repeat-containing protein [Bdellovibrionales bacterium]|nr:VCBS repeat-containing protein [Bdellovibrionales bacterium]
MVSYSSSLASLSVQRGLDKTRNSLAQSFERLSSGLRINRASDDAAGLSLADSINGDQRVYQQAIRNTNDGISLLNVAESGVSQLTSITQRLQELAESASNGALSNSQREALNTEAQALSEEFNRIVSSTSYNDLSVIEANFGSLAIQAGYGGDGSVGFTLGEELSRTIGTGEFDDQGLLTVSSISDIEHGDANGDGILDLFYLLNGNVQIKLGNGDGTFGTAGIAYSFGKFDTALSLAVGDMDNDGLADIVAVDADGDSVIATSDGDGTFTTTTSLVGGLGSVNTDIQLADFDNDGNLDYFYGEGGAVYTSFVIFGDGAGGVASSTGIGVNLVTGATTGDYDGDGNIDLTTIDSGGNVQTFFGNGDQTFDVGIAVGKSSQSGVFSGDLNNDGTDELYTIKTTGVSQFSYSEGVFSVTQNTSYSQNLTSGTIEDINGDGNNDIVAFSGSGIYVSFAEDGIISSDYTTTNFATLTSDFTVADFSGDGVFDVASSGAGGLGFFLGVGEASNTIDPINISTQAGALEAITTLEEVAARVSNELGVIGAAQSRLHSAFNNLSTSVENLDIAQSRIRDADIAKETADLVRNQILSDTGTAILGQANVLPQVALDLLRASDQGDS